MLALLPLVPVLGCAPVLTRTHITTLQYGGKANTPTVRDVDSWLSSVIDFWSQHYPRKGVEECLKNWRFIFSDDEKICQMGVCGRALTYSVGSSIIGYRNQWGYVEALVGHEAGHAIMNCQGIPEHKQHEEMARLNYAHR